MSQTDGENVLVYNAKIYTNDHQNKNWMVFNTSTGNIEELGTGNGPIEQFREINRKDFGGNRLLPGLHEAHIHVSSVGRAERSLNVKECLSIAEFKERIRKYVDTHPECSWVVGRGWEHDVMGRYPTREDIDEVSGDLPVWLSRACGHISVANSKALEVGGKKNIVLAGKYNSKSRTSAIKMICPTFVRIIFFAKIRNLNLLEGIILTGNLNETIHYSL